MLYKSNAEIDSTLMMTMHLKYKINQFVYLSRDQHNNNTITNIYNNIQIIRGDREIETIGCNGMSYQIVHLQSATTNMQMHT